MLRKILDDFNSGLPSALLDLFQATNNTMHIKALIIIGNKTESSESHGDGTVGILLFSF
jgi:hypothetical protein|tara:strand:- start:586 stop:762 length:177 start_codon:yes stop_codon:yes gene_type:complete